MRTATTIFIAQAALCLYCTTAMAQPVLEWATAIGSTSEDRGRTLALDAAGNLYVAGYYSNTVDFDPGPGTFDLTEAGGRDAYILKLDADMNFQWVKTISGTATDLINDIALDAAGNIYVTGIFQAVSDFDPGVGVYELTPVGGLDAFLAKYDPNGELLWAHGFGSQTFDNGFALDLDPDGNVVFTGFFTGTVDFDPDPNTTFNMTSSGTNDVFVSKFSTDGDMVWAKRMGGTGNEIGEGIVIDNSGNVYTTGHFTTTADFNPGAGAANLTSAGSDDIFISKLDGDGNHLWAIRFGSTSGDWGYNLGVDSLNNLYTTGYFAGTVDFDPGTATGQVFSLTSSGTKDIHLVKLDSTGALIWAKRMGGANDDIGVAMHVKPSGQLLMTGIIVGLSDLDPGPGVYELNPSGSGIADAYVLSLTETGDLDYAFGMGGTGNDYGLGVVEHPSGSIFVTGYFSNTVDFDPNATEMLLTSAGNLEIFIAKYDPDLTVGIGSMEATTGSVSVYPNPTAYRTNVRIDGMQEACTIRLIDMMGATALTTTAFEERTVIDTETLGAGMYVLQVWDSRGMIDAQRVMVSR